MLLSTCHKLKTIDLYSKTFYETLFYTYFSVSIIFFEYRNLKKTYI